MEKYEEKTRARFWKYVRKTASCWEWTSAVTHSYGVMWRRTRNVLVHRYSFEIHKGPIPDGLVVDHVCRNRICVNPDHLRAVNQAVNAVENSLSPSALNKVKTHCLRGHEFTAENTNAVKRGRACRTCTTLRQRIRKGSTPLAESDSPAALNARKTHCLKGHEFTPENTRVYRGMRACLECRQIRAKRYWQKTLKEKFK